MSLIPPENPEINQQTCVRLNTLPLDEETPLPHEGVMRNNASWNGTFCVNVTRLTGHLLLSLLLLPHAWVQPRENYWILFSAVSP